MSPNRTQLPKQQDQHLCGFYPWNDRCLIDLQKWSAFDWQLTVSIVVAITTYFSEKVLLRKCQLQINFSGSFLYTKNS